jgi:signal transduction histidine kinase
MVTVAINYTLARPNEHFLAYVDGKFYTQCHCADTSQEAGEERKTGDILAADQSFTDLVGSVGKPVTGRYEQPELGEIGYLAMPVTLAGDPSRGVIVAVFLADAERADADAAARLMLIVGAVTLLAATAGAWLVAGRILRPLHDVAATSRSITDSDLSKRIPTRQTSKGDELDDLVRTINGMLDRVESGVSAQRRFIDDAGHELRTPITIVRGHLEVLDPDDPEDIRATLALVDDELERMNRMVSDLLLLARSEQPSFLQRRPVDVAALTRDIFDKVTSLGERNFVLESVADVTSVLDPQRITQAMVALADNACHYSASDDRVAVGSSVSADRLRFWVTDSGPGVDENDRTRIFERFARGGTGGHRSDGAGLGLSIVQAIAVAHGGHVELDSVPGRGATFTVVIPVRGEES